VTRPDEEGLLREAFQDLKRDTRRRGAVPDVQAMLARARSEAPTEEEDGVRPLRLPGAWVRRGGWLSLAAAAVAALVLLDGGSRADREFERLVASYSTDLAAGAWRSPTDALLRMPGVDLGAVPSFGPALSGLAEGEGMPSGRDS
jgi:hypothetical protein